MLRFRNDLRTLSALTMVKNNQYAVASARLHRVCAVRYTRFITLRTTLESDIDQLCQGLAALDMALCIALYC